MRMSIKNLFFEFVSVFKIIFILVDLILKWEVIVLISLLFCNENWCILLLLYSVNLLCRFVFII